MLTQQTLTPSASFKSEKLGEGSVEGVVAEGVFYLKREFLETHFGMPAPFHGSNKVCVKWRSSSTQH